MKPGKRGRQARLTLRAQTDKRGRASTLDCGEMVCNRRLCVRETSVHRAHAQPSSSTREATSTDTQKSDRMRARALESPSCYACLDS